MFYIEIKDNKIVSKNYVQNAIWLNEGQKEISEEVYIQIVRVPATFELDENEEIVNIINAPEPPEFTSSKEIDAKVVSMIREQYDVNEELKTLRLGVCNNTDTAFVLYNNYVNYCRQWGQAKKIELGFVSE